MKVDVRVEDKQKMDYRNDDISKKGVSPDRRL